MSLINYCLLLALECSIPVLIPYLSLQVRLSLSKHLYKDLDAAKKVEVVRESFLDSILNDITDIAILQEVIQRSQEKLNSLTNSSSEEASHPSNLKDASTITEDQSSKSSSCHCPPDCHGDREVNGGQKEHVEKSAIPVETVKNNLTEEVITDLDLEAAVVSAGGQQEVKSEDEGYDSVGGGGSGMESSGEEENVPEDKEEKEAISETAKSTQKEDKKETDVDNLEESEPARSSIESIAKSKSEKDLKTKILSILQEAKANEAINKNSHGGGRRNYGRNFEQPVQAVLPGDKRPEKARRMDSMWSQSVARRQGSNFNGVEVAAKPVAARGVPWTAARAANAAAVKKESMLYNTEVEEFEQCRKNLETHKQQPTVKKADKVNNNNNNNSFKTTTESGVNTKQEAVSESKASKESTAKSLSSSPVEAGSPKSESEAAAAAPTQADGEESESKAASAEVTSSEISGESEPKPAQGDHEATKSESVAAEVPAASLTPTEKAENKNNAAVSKLSPVPVRNASVVPERNSSVVPVVRNISVVPPSPATRRRVELGLLLPAPRAGIENQFRLYLFMLCFTDIFAIFRVVFTNYFQEVLFHLFDNCSRGSRRVIAKVRTTGT